MSKQQTAKRYVVLNLDNDLVYDYEGSSIIMPASAVSQAVNDELDEMLWEGRDDNGHRSGGENAYRVFEYVGTVKEFMLKEKRNAPNI